MQPTVKLFGLLLHNAPGKESQAGDGKFVQVRCTSLFRPGASICLLLPARALGGD